MVGGSTLRKIAESLSFSQHDYKVSTEFFGHLDINKLSKELQLEECGAEKIKTIGDAYMVAGGVPQSVPDHAERLAHCALGMLEIIKSFSAESGHDLQLRIGLHRGPAVAGVIGTTKFAYDMWGESVNLASRLESSGEPGRIQVSDAFREGLVDLMHFETRGELKLKGVGLTRTHWLTAKKPTE